MIEDEKFLAKNRWAVLLAIVALALVGAAVYLFFSGMNVLWQTDPDHAATEIIEPAKEDPVVQKQLEELESLKEAAGFVPPDENAIRAQLEELGSLKEAAGFVPPDENAIRAQLEELNALRQTQ
jgi:Spy/CpxP family protein refolding chaperone